MGHSRATASTSDSATLIVRCTKDFVHRTTKKFRMNVSSLLWLSVTSIGFGFALATWVVLQKFSQRFIASRAIRTLHVNKVIVTAHFSVSDWIPYAAFGLGFLFAFKFAWDGAWILSSCVLFAGLLLTEPMLSLMKTPAIPDTTPVIDFALICMERSAKDKTVLHTFNEASAALEHPKIRAIVQNSLQQFYNGETEIQVLQNLVSQQTISVWGLLIWTLIVQRQMNDSTNLRKQVTKLIRERFALEQRTRPAFASLRRRLAIALTICALVGAYLMVTPTSSFFASSLQVQAIGSIAIMILVWASRLWAVELQSLQTMVR